MSENIPNQKGNEIASKGGFLGSIIPQFLARFNSTPSQEGDNNIDSAEYEKTYNDLLEARTLLLGKAEYIRDFMSASFIIRAYTGVEINIEDKTQKQMKFRDIKSVLDYTLRYQPKKAESLDNITEEDVKKLSDYNNRIDRLDTEVENFLKEMGYTYDQILELINLAFENKNADKE